MKVTVREVGGKGADVNKKNDGPKKGGKLEGVRASRASHDDKEEKEQQGGDGIIRGEAAYTEAGRIKYVNPLSLGIEEWNPDEIPRDAFIICYGKRRTGKSFWTRDFFNRVRGQYWHVNVYTGSKNNGFYQEFVDDKYIIKGFQPQGLRNLMDIQEHLGDAKLCGDIPKDAPIEAMVWLDDVIQDDDIRSVKCSHTASCHARCNYPHYMNEEIIYAATHGRY
jgi:hypothetical protein